MAANRSPFPSGSERSIAGVNISRDTFATIVSAVYIYRLILLYSSLFYMSLLLGQNELVQQIQRYFVILDSKAADLAFLR